MRIFLSFLVLLFSVSTLVAQYNPIAPPNTFRDADNPLYWGNKKPYTDYWQQDVHYKIYATIDEETDIISGNEQLTYWNNSPDTLDVVYFHLYQNAFQPNSYYDNLYHENGQDPEYGKYEEQGLGTAINFISIDGVEVETTLDNTVLIVHLNQPIPPNTSVDFDIAFKTYYDSGEVRRRMKYFMSYGKKQYNGCHWYPRIACYDKKFGWTTDQHLGREFYGDFGTYDVTLNFANDYIVGATGNLLNRNEVLPTELYEQLNMANFKDKPYGSAPSVIVERIPGERKEWHYYAENVHDFAFTANPHYRIGEYSYFPYGETGREIKAYSFAPEPHASGWQYAAEYTAKVLQVYSEDIGMYGYHKMIVADARDGMEYPMITLDGGSDPSHRGLLAHEVGHNWFYGMMNNNETYRAFMDEGFTQFLTAWSQEKIDGINRAEDRPKNNYINKFRWDRPVKDDEIYYGYMRDAILHRDPQLNTHSDGFNGALRHGGGYGHVYYKTAAMLYNLQYVLGDELFLEAMQYYFQKWSFGHPYPEDFRQSIIEYTHVDLNYFFDQWLETNKTVDYKVKSVEKTAAPNTFDITFKRKGSMQLPIDFRVMDKEGRTFDYYIPNSYFEKETEATTLPKWTGWDKLNPTYTATVTIPEAYEGERVKIKKVDIDPTLRVPDITIGNNKTKDRIDWHFDAKVWNFPDWRKYHIYYRPDIWWNTYDGLKLGWHLNGNYMNRKHKFWLTAWYNTRLFQGNLPNEAIVSGENNYYTNDRFNYNFWYETALDKFMPHTEFQLKSRFLDGLVLNQIGIAKAFPRDVTLRLNFKSMSRVASNDLNYLLYPNEWGTAGEWNNSVNIGMDYNFEPKAGDARSTLTLNGRISVSDFYNYHYMDAEYKGDRNLWRLDLKTRVYGRAGVGNGVARESALFFAGGNPEEMMENKYVRSSGFFANEWIGQYGPETNHFQYGGGLNMRGYAGYYLVEEDENGNTVQAYSGNSGIATNIELGFDRIIKWKKLPKLKSHFDFDTYLFADAGTIVYDNTAGNKEFSQLRLDAGVGAALTIKRFWKFYDIKPLTIRFDIPFYLSHAPFSEDNVQFRWVLGVSRAF